MVDEKKNVLIVDDEEELLEIMTFFLEDLGYSVIQSSSGSAAFNIIKQTPVDFIFSDVRMRNGSGLDLLDWCRQADIHIPIVLMSGFSDISAAETKARGAQGIISKPFDFDCLKTLLEEDYG
jgi:DNA-binding NtrC family response regulator